MDTNHFAKNALKNTGFHVIIIYQKTFLNDIYWLNAGDGIWTHEPLRDKSLSLTPLTKLGDSRIGLAVQNR